MGDAQTGVIPNPYCNRPSYTDWRMCVAGRLPDEVDPVSPPGCKIGRSHKIATAGSCFAQHIAKRLTTWGFRYFITEPFGFDANDTENVGVFPARFGNIYTVAQLLQTFQRAYGLFRPADTAWQRADGRLIDPFRPFIREAGYASPAEVSQDRRKHLSAVRRMFEESDIFIFTLGLNRVLGITDRRLGLSHGSRSSRRRGRSRGL